MFARPVRPLVAAAACTVLALIVYALARRSGAAWWDQWLLEAVVSRVRRPRLIAAAESLRSMFDPLPYALLAGLVLSVPLARRRLGPAVLAAAMLLAANLTTWAVQHRLGSARLVAVLGEPPWMSYWPSGHTTAAVSLAFAAVLVSVPCWRRFVAGAGAVVLVPTVLANVVLRVHVPSDVVGGVLVAAAWGFLALAVQAALPAFGPGRRPAAGALSSR